MGKPIAALGLARGAGRHGIDANTVLAEFNRTAAGQGIDARFGRGDMGLPSIGSWALYGLGTASDELPGYVVLSSGKGAHGGTSLWQSQGLPVVRAEKQVMAMDRQVRIAKHPHCNRLLVQISPKQ